MDLNTFIVALFCLMDEQIEDRRVRQRGPAPKLSDAEVLTIEIIGEFLGLDTDEAIFRHFRRHYGEWFPTLGEVHRTTFARQAANLWKLKESIWQELLSLTPHHRGFAICDSMLLPACLFARAYRCARFRGRPLSALRQGHPPQADFLRLQDAREGLVVWAHHSHLGGPRKRPRTFRSPGDR